MCGIAGFVGSGDQEDLMAMTRAMIHRGPDAQGVWWQSDKRVYLGHRRLSIMDIAGGTQPMWSPDSQIGIIFNGEIYNHLELRSELSRLGHTFQSSHSDTEVLLQGYMAWQTELPEKLNGMWAFAIYDRQRNRLFLSRDRFGKKPLYYHAKRGLFAFASELTALLCHPGITASLSQTSLHKYFAYGFIPAPATLLQKVYKLEAGCNLLYELATESITIRPYWRFVLEPFDTRPANPIKVWGETLLELLTKAVERRLMADVPLGVLLSGGIDSSAISALAAQLTKTKPLESFSIGFTQASFDESYYAKLMATHIGSLHHATTFSIDMARETLPTVLGQLDEPMGDDSLLPTYLVCKEAKKRVTVALSGDGADELFAGYDPFKALRYAKIYHQWIPKPLHQAIDFCIGALPASHRYMSLGFKLKRALRGMGHPPALWNPLWLAPLTCQELSELFQQPLPPEELYEEAINAWESCAQENLIDKTTQFYVKLYLQDDILTKVDRASMMNSLELRSPFLDRDLVDFARQIPASYRLRGGITKFILKEALKPLLPSTILKRKKQGFALPVGQWFWQNQLPFPPRNRHPDEAASFQKLLTLHQSGQEDHRMFLWNQLTLDHFLLRHTQRIQ